MNSQTCQNCDGKGEIVLKSTEAGHPDRRMTCPSCQGKGVVGLILKRA